MLPPQQAPAPPSSQMACAAYSSSASAAAEAALPTDWVEDLDEQFTEIAEDSEGEHVAKKQKGSAIEKTASCEVAATGTASKPVFLD